MRGKLAIFALALGLLGMSGSWMDQFDLVILGPDNDFTEVIEPNVAISRSGFSGPLLGTNLEFSCGSCTIATFDDATSQIGSGMKVCNMKPQEARHQRDTGVRAKHADRQPIQFRSRDVG